LEEWESKRHCRRLNEYEQYSVSLGESIELLTGSKAHPQLVRELEGSNFFEHIKSCIEGIKIGGSISIEKGGLLYCLTRALRPEVVVETGVANGVSSAFILKALDDNAKGRLYSIDLHCREGISVPPGKQLGWVIPKHLKLKWNLMLGESTKVLPGLLRKLGSIDIFLHDSRHSTEP